MVQANDLRIGNMVKVKGRMSIIRAIETTQHPETFRYYDLEQKTLHVKVWFGMQLIEPIPLSPELLEKIGFVKNAVTHSLKVDDMPYGYKTISVDRNTDNGHGCFVVSITDYKPKSIIGTDCIFIRRDLKYLHELQNLTYSLTVTDLAVKI